MSRTVILRFNGGKSDADTIASELSQPNNGIEYSKSTTTDDYDLQEPYKSEIAGCIEFLLRIINVATGIITLRKLISEHLSKNSKQDKIPKPPLYIVVDGHEYNIADLSDKELNQLLSD